MNNFIPFLISLISWGRGINLIILLLEWSTDPLKVLDCRIVLIQQSAVYPEQ